MKNWLFYLVAAWIGLVSATSVNIVVCVQPTGVARIQLADHDCCSASCNSPCTECALALAAAECFEHSDDCCQDVAFPFSPAPVVTTCFSAPAASLAWLDPADINQGNSKIPCIFKDRIVCDPAVNTAILLI